MTEKTARKWRSETRRRRFSPRESGLVAGPARGRTRIAAMKIGVPKETKIREYRVGMTPAGVRELTRRGHEVLVERGAGEGSGIGDQFYVEAGARIVPTAADAWSAELVVKVKEPL